MGLYDTRQEMTSEDPSTLHSPKCLGTLEGPCVPNLCNSEGVALCRSLHFNEVWLYSVLRTLYLVSTLGGALVSFGYF